MEFYGTSDVRRFETNDKYKAVCDLNKCVVFLHFLAKLQSIIFPSFENLLYTTKQLMQYCFSGSNMKGTSRSEISGYRSSWYDDFWNISPCILIEVYLRFRSACYIQSKTLTNYYQTTRPNIPEVSHYH